MSRYKRKAYTVYIYSSWQVLIGPNFGEKRQSSLEKGKIIALADTSQRFPGQSLYSFVQLYLRYRIFTNTVWFRTNSYTYTCISSRRRVRSDFGVGEEVVGIPEPTPWLIPRWRDGRGVEGGSA